MSDRVDTPRLPEILAGAIDAKLYETHTSMPGRVVKYDQVTKLADVQPCLKKKYATSGEVVALPVITNVPVCPLQTAFAIISMPVKVGDYVELHFQERSIDAWKSMGGIVSPEDPRKHHISDAIAIPAMSFSGYGLPADPDAILIQNDKFQIRVGPSTFSAKNLDTGAELVDLFDQLLTALQGEAMLFNKPLYLQIQTLLGSMKE